MSLVGILIVTAFIGFIVWVILQIPMPQIFRNIILGVVAFATVLWLLQVLGISTGLPIVRLTR